jgi:hypothetical protein
MFSCEKIDETNDADQQWSKKLNTAPMIGILVTLLLAIVVSFTWRDQAAQGRKEPTWIRRNPRKVMNRDQEPT